MQNLQRSLSLIFLYLAVMLLCEQLAAQCPGAARCDEAYFFCSLDEMNGFSCNNEGGGATCSPLCSSNGSPNWGKTTWWAFYSQGGNVSITLSTGVCLDFDTDNDFDGLTWGIWGDCHCSEEIYCSVGCLHPGITSNTFQGNLKPCKVYYLWIYGCENDMCNFTINTTGGGPPTISQLGFINNVASGIIQPVCAGACNYKFFVDPVKASCPVTYLWTLDGIEVLGNSNEIKLSFPEEGDFEICVTVFIENPNNTIPCAQQGPKCATVKVRAIPDRFGVPRTICYEEVNQGAYKWHTQFITSSGIYREQFVTPECCKYDSIVEFTVLPEPEVFNVFYISCDNKPFIDLLGRSYLPCKDHMYISLPKSDQYKCDSAITLTAINVDLQSKWSLQCSGAKVELLPNIGISNSCGIGETYKFYYKWYKKNDTLQKTISTADRLLVDAINEDYCLEVNVEIRLGTDTAFCTKKFCDSINEGIIKTSTKNIVLSFCDSTVINNQVYSQSTTFTQQLINIYGCDSIINTEIIIQKSSQTEISQSACDSIKVNNKLYTTTGDYKQILTNANGCDSILNLDIRIQSSGKTDISQTACDSVLVNNISYKQSGKYQQLLQTVAGCDSILNLDLIIQSSSQTDISQTDCDSVVVNGKTYKQSGDFIQSFQGINGCDSILKIHVNIPSSNVSPLVISKCDSVTINTTHYTQSGNYSQQLTSANGCDSILNIDLTILKSNSASISFASCDSAIINGQKYYQSGSYTQLLQNVNHCDSTLNLEVKIQSGSQSEISQSDCDSIIVNGQSYNQTGDYTQLLKNVNQCDSLLTVHFTRLTSNSSNLALTSCDSVVVNGQVYKQSGNYTQMQSNVHHCDSLINLKINIANSNSSSLSLSSCDSAIVNGKTYAQTGNYVQVLKNVNQCDSILNLNLEIFKNSSINYDINSCDSAIVNGIVYKQTGNYIQNLKNIHQCDSTLNIQFNVLKSSESNFIQNACDSAEINGIKYFASGNYLQYLKNSNGCDSTIKIELNIKPGDNWSLDAGMDTSICEGEILKLNGVFTGQINFIWQSTHGRFENPKSTTPIYYPGAVGDDRIYLKATADCGELLDSLTIHVLRNQIIKVTGDTIIEPCKEIRFTATGGTNYIWTPASLIDCLDQPCSKVKLKSNEPFRFTVTTDGPCPVPANFNLSLSEIQSDIYLPNAFSPNGDNINDQFIPVFNCDQVDYYNLRIFDRWGNLIFESNDKLKGWNGKYQNVNMIPGVYPYIVQYELHGLERKVKGGDVTLIR